MALSVEKNETVSRLGDYGASIAALSVLIAGALLFLWISRGTGLQQFAIGVLLSSITLAVALALVELCWPFAMGSASPDRN